MTANREVAIELAFAKADHVRLGSDPPVFVTDTSGRSCPTEVVASPTAVDDGVVVRLRATCAAAPKNLHYTLWPALGDRHRLLLHVEDRDVIVEPTSPDVVLGNGLPTSPTPKRPGSALVLGFEHVALGYDHLLFLFGLALASVMAGEKRKRLFLAVTAFTLTHTAALALAFRASIPIPERPVEVLIACTIGFVGLETWRGAKRGANPLACAAFGLVHGLGFGSAFRGALGTTTGSTLLLATLGVEAAQLLGVTIGLGSLMLPGLRETKVRRGLAASLFVVGLSLAVWRIFA